MYTGELMDANALVYLRARYYHPGVGVFTSLDPVEGDVAQVMSLNRYGYVAGNPINFTDRSGLQKDEGVKAGELEYSCHCGWIDWNHVGRGEPAYELMNNLVDASHTNWILGEHIGSWLGFKMAARVGGFGISLQIYEDIAVVPRDMLYFASFEDIEALALHIYMDAYEDIEETHCSFHTSCYSEEDLPSNLIGFYVAAERNKGRAFLGDIELEIKQVCQTLDSLEPVDGKWVTTHSQNVHENTYNSGKEFKTKWKNWYPRLLTLLDCSGNIDTTDSVISQCNQENRAFPAQFQRYLDIRDVRSPIPYFWKSKGPVSANANMWLPTEYYEPTSYMN